MTTPITSSPAPVVALEGVGRRFGNVDALAGFSLEIPRGTVSMLLGPNGAGKTTLVRIVTGALRPDTGSVHTFGVDPATDGEQVRARCGVVPARPALYDRLSGLDNLRYAARLWRVADLDGAIAQAAARFDITHALGQRVGTYSTGMRARLALARATLHQPDLLLLDEPTAGLDPESSRAVLGLIGELTEAGTTVLMCTHLLAEAEGLADHVTVMEQGRTLAAGSPAELVRALWQHVPVVVEADDDRSLDVLADMPGVLSYRRDVRAIAEVDGVDRIPELIGALVARGVRLTRVEPREPTLEDLYFAVRRGGSAAPLAAGATAGATAATATTATATAEEQAA